MVHVHTPQSKLAYSSKLNYRSVHETELTHSLSPSEALLKGRHSDSLPEAFIMGVFFP